MFDKEFEKILAEYGLTPEKYEQCLNLIIDKTNKNTDVDWAEIKDMYELPLHPDSLRKASSTPFGGASVYQYFKNKNISETSQPDEMLNQLTTKKLEIEKERYKLQTEKLENNKWIRENARDELIVEKIIDAVKSLKPLKIPEVLPVVHSPREYALLFGDEHYGVDFEIKGLFGEILNAYSPEIFEDRMWDLFNRAVEIIVKESITKLHVFSMGDFSDGLIRIKQLMILRYGVIEGSVKYADFISNWLNELTNYVVVEYQMTRGNHTECRFFNQPKGTFTNENTDLYVREIIKTRLANNPNFHMTENPTGYIFAQIAGLNVLGIHGEVKDLEKAIKDFSATYRVQIDLFITGHLHHSASENVGVGRDVIRVPSIIGIDDFSMSLNKTSNAGATLVVLEEGFGKVQEFNLKLK